MTPASGTLARLSDMRGTTNAFSSGPYLAQRTPREMEYDVHGISVNDTDAPPNARPLTNNDERAFLHPNPPTLTIRIPPRRLCSVCSRVYPILDKQIPTEAANTLPGQADDDDGNERYVGGVLNVAPSPTVETEHVRRGVHQILQRPLHNNQNIINAPVPDRLVCRRK
ncbi:hypothetical protein BGY98DRAFT_938850 [Russula aff. rugulosa BPL654]|nr:hypothetical protein BGY98DRAFT_938850 [Russula aff. rugulosa BPL654]